MKVWQVLLMLIFGYCTYIFGAIREYNAKGMKPSRKFDLTVKSLFSIFTFKRFYICDECGKIHKRMKDDLDICGGWYEHKVFVSQNCAQQLMTDVKILFRKNMFHTPIDRLIYWIRIFSNSDKPLDQSVKDLLYEASNQLDALYKRNQELNKKLYG